MTTPQQPIKPGPVSARSHGLTAGPFGLHSLALLGVTSLTLLLLGWLGGVATRQAHMVREEQARAAVAQQELTELAQLEGRYGPSIIDAAIASVPGELNLPDFLAWLEAKAASRHVTVQYNFTALEAEQEKQLPDQWAIPAHFQGTAGDLEALLGSLERGLYHVAVRSLDFDTTDPTASQLTLELVVYGGSDV